MSLIKILHVTPHLGGGVGRCLSSLIESVQPQVYREVLLLEEPIDKKFKKNIERKSKVKLIDWQSDISQSLSIFDIIQIEFWNHPAILKFLNFTKNINMRRVFWCHISGTGVIRFPTSFLQSNEVIIFSSEQSNISYNLNRPVINSGFALNTSLSSIPLHSRRSYDFMFAGQLDFKKIHKQSPKIFNEAGRVSKKNVYIFGDGADKGSISRSVIEPNVSCKGHTDNLEYNFRNTKFFLYPLAEDHYGTGENVIKEAMSLGCIPVLLSNNVEVQITSQFSEVLCYSDLNMMTMQLKNLLDANRSQYWQEVSSSLAIFAKHKYSVRKSCDLFLSLYQKVLLSNNSSFDMQKLFGSSSIEWYRSFRDHSKQKNQDNEVELGINKGSREHFRKYFSEFTK
ncbi:hypothetical protein N9C64_00505 [Paracoccaceae bacterium]|nr:hypothetical protein [Paracoccaceae bacterium]